MRRLFTITTSIVFLSITLTYGQNCKEKIINQIQGIWIKEGRIDTTLIIVKDKKLAFNFKGAKNWDEPYAIYITNKIPQISDSISDCTFIELAKANDTLHYRILAMTDTTMSLMKYTFSKYRFFDVDDNPMNHIDRMTVNYRKAKGLPPGYNLRASVFGIWRDEDTKLTLKPDSTFSITFSKSNYEYTTCGKFLFDGNIFILKDLQDKIQIIYTIDCDNLKITPIENKSGYLENKHLLFDENNEIHLHYNWLGLWLKETHMILTKMRE